MKVIGRLLVTGIDARGRARRIVAGIGAVDAGEHLDQRRLAGAVLAEQRMHLAGAHVEIDRIERQRAGEALGEAGDLEQGPVASSVMCLALARFDPLLQHGGELRSPPVRAPFSAISP